MNEQSTTRTYIVCGGRYTDEHLQMYIKYIIQVTGLSDKMDFEMLMNESNLNAQKRRIQASNYVRKMTENDDDWFAAVDGLCKRVKKQAKDQEEVAGNTAKSSSPKDKAKHKDISSIVSHREILLVTQVEILQGAMNNFIEMTASMLKTMEEQKKMLERAMSDRSE